MGFWPFTLGSAVRDLWTQMAHLSPLCCVHGDVVRDSIGEGYPNCLDNSLLHWILRIGADYWHRRSLCRHLGCIAAGQCSGRLHYRRLRWSGMLKPELYVNEERH